ncbi:putative circularly permuted ATP-grasp superfamily protein [Polymorphobacter multimanifer]|uniref:Putative circularly permuted ATP-grasp superfamily protein n=1 Tax=Polymorphobacter multimanifer TaxID=1070431 RepID=A0A841L5X7_9SPHN|nr:circularly permuted type 2 ATP-grasp protein [Polymorphobacter multimanifer]MBB6226373.1 putative circularly permuted ATP-grasp superfamily protein [Polymorphobacter multimanifer]
MAGIDAFDEMFGSSAAYNGGAGPLFGEATAINTAYRWIRDWLDNSPADVMAARRRQAELFFRRIGITFAVYGDPDAAERLIPFDIVPRILARAEWNRLEKGLVQRVNALNAFLGDVYGNREILRAGIVPEDLVLQNPGYCLHMAGRKPPGGIWTHIAGIDLVRTGPDEFFVLEDNARTPSGVSYMLENREVMLKLVPELFEHVKVAPVETYPEMLLETLGSVSPRGDGAPVIVLLTPGRHNSAFYEHSFLADKLGIELVEGSDLFVRDDVVYMRTTQGPERVDVIYRRIDDDFIDPLVFNPASMLGVPGLMAAYAQGNVTLANAVGTGIADDKAIYSYMPEIVKFYTGEEPILKNVPTWRCREPEALGYVLDNLAQLVVKEVDGSGGYGMLIGPHAPAATLAAFAAKLKAMPEKFIAQPTLALSTCPTAVDSGIAPRHVDLRPFVLSGRNGVNIVPGGLTRVAMTQGSLVVNSSQGGGTKDTWVVDDWDA